MEVLSLNELLSPNFMVKRMLGVHNAVYKHIRELPEESFAPYWYGTARGMKQLAVIDLIAEQTFILAVTTKFGSKNVRLVGEESLNQNVDLETENRICVLVDMVDGTDLLQRNFSNWCSAVVVFDPQKREILGSYVAVPSTSPSQVGYMYYATKNSGAFKIPLQARINTVPIPLKCSTPDRVLKDASICMYGQKNDNFECLLSLSRKKKFSAWLRDNRRINKQRSSNLNKQGELKFRFYNLAGNPMMVRLGEGIVDVVFDINGQFPHDVVPGAFIASEAGAVIGNLRGEELSSEDLAKSLIRPGNSPLSYVLAANRTMFEEFVGLLS